MTKVLVIYITLIGLGNRFSDPRCSNLIFPKVLGNLGIDVPSRSSQVGDLCLRIRSGTRLKFVSSQSKIKTHWIDHLFFKVWSVPFIVSKIKRGRHT